MTAGLSTAATGPRLRRSEWTSIGGMAAVVLGLHVVGWGTLVWAVAPERFALGSGQVFSAGLGLTAYMLGMRHAFDADHIAAIDNTTRKLMAEGRRPLSVGFWFSLGHSSIVFGLCALLAAGARALAGPLANDGSALEQATGQVGAAVSGVFLYLIGIINLVVLLGIVSIFRRMRRGHLDEAELEAQLSQRGLLNRVLGRVTRAVRLPWHMYPVGLLFGLGFDTATEVALLVLAGGAAAFSLPWYAILTLPVLFAAGMSLLDSIDGCFMNFAYGWAFSEPVRKVYYNITITGLSVAVAMVVGTIELASLVAARLGVSGGVLAAIGGLDLDVVGCAIVALFLGTWLVAVTVWRVARIEERWTDGLRTTPSEPSVLS
jgi:high-affinity nickel-transport protein